MEGVRVSYNVVEEVETIPGDITSITKELSEAVAQRAAASQAAAEEPPVSQQPAPDGADNLPGKLKGKSATEIAAMYQNLESLYGRMANDLGTQRKLTDRLLDLKRSEDLSRNNPEPPTVDRAKLLEDPTAALTQFLEQREATRESESAARLGKLESSLAEREFVAKHPDYDAIANDPGFTAWVQSSTYRVRAAASAYNGDWTAADDLLSEYKERKSVIVPDSKPNEQDTQAAAAAAGVEAARKAALETSGGSAKPAEGKTGKVFRRADLLALKLRDPETYYDEGFQAEIMSAYAQGRVK
jgi:hypothetical protein